MTYDLSLPLKHHPVRQSSMLSACCLKHQHPYAVICTNKMLLEAPPVRSPGSHLHPPSASAPEPTAATD